MSTETAPTVVVKETKPVFSWDDLPAPVEAEYVRNPRIDVVADTPQIIRERAHESYDRYVKAFNESDGKKLDLRPLWRQQNCGSSERAEAFVKLLKRYGRNVEPRMTVRTALDENKTIVKYLCKIYEARDDA